MRIKRLELVGFKSFREKTQLSFEENILSIVGPNGCGKSNIVDALKWCTGTLSNKTLRADELLDVIFKGAEDFSSAGFASVSVTFDNASKILPLPYPEVTITRKVYKNLDSAFYINNSPCRLKDIRDVLQNTGLAEGGYAIIEQGKVDRLINSNPYERRYIFDEACGIARYKEKKQEAVSRLEKVAQNITSLDQVISEVAKSVHSLKVQAGRARKYKELQDQYNELRRKLHAKEHSGLLAELSAIESRKQEIYQKIKDVEKERADSAAKLNTLNEEKDQITAKIKQLELLSGQKDAVLASLRQSLKQLESETAQLAEEKSRHEEFLRELERGTRASYEESRLLAQKKAEIKTKIESLQKSKDDCEAKAAALETGLAALRRKSEEIASSIQVMGDQMASMNKLLSELNLQCELLAQQRKQKEREAAEIRTKITTISTQLDTFNSEVSQLASEIERCQRELAQANEALSLCEADSEEISKRLSDIEMRIRALNSKREGLSLLRDGAELGKPAGLRKLKELVAPKAGNESIVDLFLAEFGDYYVTASIEDVINAAGSGINREHGFIIDTEGAKALDGCQDMSSVIDITAEDPAIKATISSFLRSFVIAADWHEAKKIASSHAGVNVITATGGIMRANTFKFPAYTENELSTHLVRLAFEKEEISRALAGAQSRQSSLRDRISRLSQLLADLSGKKEVCSSRIADATSALNELNSKISVIEGDLSKIVAGAAELTARRNSIEGQVAEIRTRQDAAEKELASLAEQINGMQSSLQQAKAGLNSVVNDLNSAAIEASHIDTQLAKISELLKERDNHMRREAAELEACRDKFEKAQEAKAQKSAQLEAESKEADKYKIELDSFSKYMESLEEELAGVSEAAGKLDEKLGEFNRLYHSCELEFTTTSTKIEEHKKRVMEELNQSVESILEEQAKAEGAVTGESAPQETAEVAKQAKDAEEDIQSLKARADELIARIRHFGAVNMIALEKLDESEQRHKFLTQQRADLIESKQKLARFIEEINKECLTVFDSTIRRIGENFNEIFRKVFSGGKAEITVMKEEGRDPLEFGVEIFAKLPGKKTTKLSLMSGGEKALTSIALTLALFKVKQGGVCVLDEVDAPLDEENVVRFCNLLRELAGAFQFIIITHNKRTMQISDRLYGVTMQPKGITKIIDVDLKTKKLEDVEKLVKTENN